MQKWEVLLIITTQTLSLSGALLAEAADKQTTATLAVTPPCTIFETGSRHNQRPASHIASIILEGLFITC